MLQRILYSALFLVIVIIMYLNIRFYYQQLGLVVVLVSVGLMWRMRPR